MSNYFFKGGSLPINVITVTSGATSNAPSYNSFPIVNPSVSQLQPLTFGFYSGNTDVANLATAQNQLYNYTQNSVSIPSECKSIRIITIGGGGGGGGAGGKGSQK